MTSKPARPPQRRDQRRLQRRRRRGGHGRGPVALQRAARAVVNGLDRGRLAVLHAVRGDRPLVLMLLGAIVLSVLMLSGPTQRYLDTRERVTALDAKARALEGANADLEQRQRDLQDPTNIELLAREQQGFIRPGEVPYTLIPPEVERPRITVPRDAAPSQHSAAWYERVWNTVENWVGSS